MLSDMPASQPHQRLALTPAGHRSRAVRLALVTTLIVLAIVLPAITYRYHQETDVVQDRLHRATPPLGQAGAIAQTLTCTRPNLSQIELLPAVYGAPGVGHLELTLLSQEGQPLAHTTLDAGAIRHNAPLVFSFAALRTSAGSKYTLSITGTPGITVGFWQSGVNAYGEGDLSIAGLSTEGDLVLTTRCQYDVRTLLADSSAVLAAMSPHTPSLFLLLFVPGLVIHLLLRPPVQTASLAQVAMILGTSLAGTALAFLWTGTLGWHWQQWSIRLVLGILALYTIVHGLRSRSSRQRRIVVAFGDGWPALVVAALILILRMVQTRGLAFPAWADSPQHALVTELLVHHGRIPSSYEPLLPIERFFYHPGFHIQAAVMHWLSGLDIPSSMLLLGQALNAAAALSAYLLAWRLSRNQLTALLAEAIVGTVSYLPAYYVSWGRYTQLTGLVLLPPLLCAAMDWLQARERDGRSLVLAAMLAAGLFVIHARVMVLGALFLIVLLAEETGHRIRRGESVRELGLRSGLLLLSAVALAGPWLVPVVQDIVVALRTAGRSLAGNPAYNVVSMHLLFVPRNRALILIALLGVLLGLLRGEKGVRLMGGWCLVTVLALNPGWIGLPATDFVNNDSAAISLFVPLSFLAAYALTTLGGLAMQYLGHWSVGPTGLGDAARHMLGAAIVAGSVWAGLGLVSIVNPATVLATAEDRAAMQWIDAHVPENAVFLINCRYWQASAYIGTDGGYWIPQMTGRRTLLPPVSYTYGEPAYVRHINAVAEMASNAKADDKGLLQLLEQEGVTHVYIGSRGGPFKPEEFAASAHYRTVYSTGEVWIMEVNRK